MILQKQMRIILLFFQFVFIIKQEQLNIEDLQ